MSTPLPQFDPYAVLGVDSKATASEIKTAYRKLALKCHPDKIHDDDLKAKAVVEFQKVQESYEILTDDTRRQKYDQNVYINSLRKDLAAQQASYNREYRDGRMYEERVPADAAFFTGSDEMLYTDEPASYSPKYYDSPKRPHTKATEEKRKPKSTTAYTYSTSRPTTSSNTKTSDREHAKATHYASAKTRTKERRRDASEKYERSGHFSDSDYSDREFEPKSKPKSQSYSQSYSQPYSQSYSQPQPPPAPAPPPPRYTKTKIEVETRYPRESAPPRRKAETVPTYTQHDYDYDLPPERAPSPPRRAPSPPRRKPEVVPMAASYEDIEYSSTDESFVAGREGDFDNHRKSKVDSQQVWAKEYMFIKKDQPPMRPPTDWPDEFEKPERRHSESTRHSSPRTTHTYKETVTAEASPRTTHTYKETVTSEAPPRTSRRSHEDLGSPERGHSSKYEYDRKVDRGHERGRTVPSLSTATSQKVSSSNRAPPTITRSATAPYPPRTRREGVVRSESKGPFSTLMSMVTGLPSDAKVSSSRTSTTRATSRARGVSRPRGTERNDSGYSSGPSTPEMPQGVSSKTKYKNYDTIEREPKEAYVSTSYESVPSSRSERTRDRSEARPKHSRKTTTTYTYPSKDKEPEIVTRRPAAVSSKMSTSSSSSYSDRTLYREIPSDFVRDGGHRYHRQKGQAAY